jgi:heme/copper-type cytochrome/quinol oxidase subunit 1
MVMNEVKKHRSAWPAVLFGVAALGLVLIGWSVELADMGDQALDINLLDTYFVVPAVMTWYTFNVLLIAFAAIYLILSRWLDSRLAIGHFVLWVPLPLLCLIWIYSMANEVSRRYYSYTTIEDEGTFFQLDSILAGAAIMFLMGGLLFLVNVVISVIRSARPTSNRSI